MSAGVGNILHTADPHQGLLTHSWLDPSTGLPSRLLDVARSLEASVDVALEREVTCYLCAGDLFQGPNPDAATLGLFDAQLRRLKHAGIPTIIIAGNHDRPPFPGRPWIGDLFDDRTNGVYAVSGPEIIETRDLSIACLPSVGKHLLMGDGTITRADGDLELAEALERILLGFGAHDVDVLTTHYSVQGAVLGNEKDIAIVQEPMLSQAALRDGPWRYVALGHIHKAQTIDLGPETSTVARYAGSLNRMSFGEEHESKSASIVHIDSGYVAVEPVELPARRFVTLDFRTLAEGAAVEYDSLRDAIVRLRFVEGSRDPLEGRKWALQQGAAHVKVEIDRSARREAMTRSAAFADSELQTMSDLEELDAFLEAKDVPQGEREPIRARARMLLEGSGEESAA